MHRVLPQGESPSTSIQVTFGTLQSIEMRWSSIVRAEMRFVPRTTARGALVTLQDGRRYTVVRYVLITDDFQACSMKQGSSGGCYLLPLRIPVMERRGAHAIRIVGATPSGVSSNVVINSIIPDIVQCTTTGVIKVMPDGDEITIFLDIVGYIGDYVGTVRVLDLLGVNAISPCPL